MTEREENQKMKVKALFAAILGLTLALSALTGVAAAGKPDDPGKSEEAPGQVKEEATAADPDKGNSASAAGQNTAGTSSTLVSTNQQERAAGAGIKSSSTTAKWTTCSTGGGQGTSATCSGSQSATGVLAGKPDGSKQYGNAETAAQIANSRGAPSGTVLTGPGNSQPHKVAVCPRKSNKSGGVDVHAVKSYDTSACAEQRPQAPPGQQVSEEIKPAEVVVQQQPAVQQEQGGVLGAQAVVKQQPKAKPQARGGVLGEIAAVPSGELPFTGIHLWMVLLAGIGLLAAGLGARKAMD
jgi:hypothetical protein